MTADRWQKAKELFLQVRDQSPDARKRALDEIGGEDPELRDEVASLLARHDRAADFLEAPAVVITPASPEPPAPIVGRSIGRYTIIRELAAGGMGVVYEARQEQPERIIALKVARIGLGSTVARRRFEHEAEILARLSHPAIAQIHEAGTYEEGGTKTPYFAMELVPDAKTITEHSTASGLSVANRLTLFAEVCDAVHHGHQRGIIHRDLKPGNILVDANGRPKIIDFGVARAVDPEATLAATRTSSNQWVGTLQYMSPEQLGGDPHAVDVRSDVYSLGVVLFEMLCGQLPYDVTRSSVYEAARTVQERPPRRPSAYKRSLRGDLETVILKCLEKDPQRRYQSAAELASDIRRHLRHEPIEARRDSAIYVLRRNLYRHRRIALVLATIVVGGILYATTATALWREVESQRHLASVRLGRSRIQDGNPLAASELLWREFFRRDSDRTRFALWEFYLNYPRVYANGDFGRQVAVAFSPSNRWLLTVTKQGQIIVYNAASGVGAVESSVDIIEATTLTFSPDGERLYIGDRAGYVHACAFDGDTGRIAATETRVPESLFEKAQQGPITCLALSQCGRWLAAARDVHRDSSATSPPYFRDSRVALWDLTSGTVAWDALVSGRCARALDFSRDAEHLAIAFERGASSDGINGVEVWARRDRTVVSRSCHDGPVRRVVVFSERGDQLYSADDHLRVSDFPSDREWRETQCESVSKWGIRSLARGRGAAARFLAFGAGDGAIRFYDTAAETLAPIAGYHACEADRVDVCFSADGHRVGSVGPDGLSVWAFDPVQQMLVGSGNAELLDVSEDGSLLVVRRESAGSGHFHVDVVSGDHRAATWQVGHSRVALSANGRRLAMADDGRFHGQDSETPLADHSDDRQWRLRVYEAPNWTESGTLSLGPVPPVNVMRWLDREGQILLAGYCDGTLAAYHVGVELTEIPLLQLPSPAFGSACTRFDVGQNGEWLAACCEGSGGAHGRVCVWRATGRSPTDSEFGPVYEQVADFTAQPVVWHVALTRDEDGRLLAATSGSERVVRLWDAVTGKPAGRLVGHGDTVWYCGAVRDHLLVTASYDGTVRVWDAALQEELCVIARRATRRLHVAVCGDIIALCDGEHLWRHDLGEVDKLVEQNRPYEAERLRHLDANADFIPRAGRPSHFDERTPIGGVFTCPHAIDALAGPTSPGIGSGLRSRLSTQSVGNDSEPSA